MLKFLKTVMPILLPKKEKGVEEGGINKRMSSDQQWLEMLWHHGFLEWLAKINLFLKNVSYRF